MDRIFLSAPHVTGRELDFIKEAFDTNWIGTLGPQVSTFEEEICRATGARNAVALSSGTGALHLALLVLGVERGDAVFCSTLTFAASANAIAYVGARPVFVDSDRRSWNVGPEVLEEALEDANRKNRLPKALICVDLYGQCAEYDAIVPLCERYGVPVVEDAAEALGATYQGRRAGTFGEMAALSFNGNKIITSSGGGMLLTRSREQAGRALHLATQARDPAAHYEHSEIGYNYRMPSICAAVGRGQLETLEEKVKRRRENFEFYREHLEHLSGLKFMPEVPGSRGTRWLTCLTVDEKEAGVSREDLRRALERENIEARPVWKPMHLQPVFKGCKVYAGAVSEKLFEDGLCLPSGSGLTRGELERVVGVLLARCSP